MKIAIGSDHAGFDYKEAIKKYLQEKGHNVQDFGTDSNELTDYPLFIRPAAEAVARGECDQGIVLGGSGNGEAITANKVKGIRCAVCWDEFTAEMGKKHNNANVISIGQRTISQDMALKIVEIWLATEYERGGRHERRVNMIEKDT